LEYFMAVWNIFCGQLVYFLRFGMFGPDFSWHNIPKWGYFNELP
jgi:hypothetical protein